MATAEGVISSTTYSEQREGSAETWEAPMADSRREANWEIALDMAQPQQEELYSCKLKVERVSRANCGERRHVALGRE